MDCTWSRLPVLPGRGQDLEEDGFHTRWIRIMSLDDRAAVLYEDTCHNLPPRILWSVRQRPKLTAEPSNRVQEGRAVDLEGENQIHESRTWNSRW